MEMELLPAGEPGRAVLRRLLELYSYDVSELFASVPYPEDSSTSRTERPASLLSVCGRVSALSVTRHLLVVSTASFEVTFAIEHFHVVLPEDVAAAITLLASDHGTVIY